MKLVQPEGAERGFVSSDRHLAPRGTHLERLESWRRSVGGQERERSKTRGSRRAGSLPSIPSLASHSGQSNARHFWEGASKISRSAERRSPCASQGQTVGRSRPETEGRLDQIRQIDIS